MIKWCDCNGISVAQPRAKLPTEYSVSTHCIAPTLVRAHIHTHAHTHWHRFAARFVCTTQSSSLHVSSILWVCVCVSFLIQIRAHLLVLVVVIVWGRYHYYYFLQNSSFQVCVCVGVGDGVFARRNILIIIECYNNISMVMRWNEELIRVGPPLMIISMQHNNP